MSGFLPLHLARAGTIITIFFLVVPRKNMVVVPALAKCYGRNSGGTTTIIFFLGTTRKNMMVVVPTLAKCYGRNSDIIDGRY